MLDRAKQDQARARSHGCLGRYESDDQVDMVHFGSGHIRLAGLPIEARMYRARIFLFRNPGMSTYADVTLEGSFSAVSKLILEVSRTEY